MAYTQSFIAMNSIMRATNPEAAALAREHTLENTIKMLEEHHRLLLAANETEQSLAYNKAKLRAYYACKQKDKTKCRKAIDRYMEVL
jgi:DNA-binding GntR family transcriptional regulator